MEIYSFKKGVDKLIFKIQEYKNKKYFDIRFHFEQNGEWQPTKKGITLPISYLEEFKTGIEKLEHIINEVNEINEINETEKEEFPV